MMRSQSISSPEDQSVTFVELFFDLVFVFSVTQIVSLLHGGLDWVVVGQAILVFWLVWWAWSQFTWALNAADTTHPFIQFGTLLATAVAFFMAVALPGAFGERALWFAITYVLVRAMGLTIYALVASENPALKTAVRAWILVSLGGLVAVLLGGILGGAAQFWFWAAAILLDVIAGAIAGRFEGWDLHPEHFAERHGLFVIIALGETLIVAAAQASGGDWTAGLMSVAILAVAVTCGLWWSYFPRTKPVLDRAFEAASGIEGTKLGRDVFSFLHFPMLCGVIAYAFVVEEVVAHPGEALALDGRVALAAGLLLFVGGMAVAIWRATRRVLRPRVVLILVTAAAVVVASGISGQLSLAIAFAGVLVIVVIEQRSRVLAAARFHE
jgi:low temperature requirement protein LtrA